MGAAIIATIKPSRRGLAKHSTHPSWKTGPYRDRSERPNRAVAQALDETAFVEAVLHEMQQRVDPGGLYVRIGREVGVGAELGRGVATLLPAILIVMQQRIDPGRRHIGVRVKVAAGAEQPVRVASLMPAILHEMLVRVHP